MHKLPPHRPDSDHKIRIDNGNKVPWIPFFGMSREELLVLKKTLTDLLVKNYIRMSSSSAGAPVLFVQKAGRAHISVLTIEHPIPHQELIAI